MNTEALYTFIQLASLKNYTKTANQLYIAQSTVTNRIFELEAELGRQLFIRSKKQLQLTAEGEHFLPYAQRILELEKLAAKEIGTLNPYRHSLRIGTANTIYDCYLTDKTVAFINSNPDISLNITIGHSLPLIRMLLDQALDMAFTYVPYTKHGLTCTPFRTDTLLLVTGKENDAYKAGITKAQLASVPYYYCDFNFQELGSYIRELFPNGHIFPFEMDRSANLLPYLTAGSGYSFLPESLVINAVNNGNLRVIPLIDFSIPKVSSYILAADKRSNYQCLQSYIACLS